MCGIIGYTGKQNALPVLVNSLKKLEYRGYDSVGLSTLGSDLHLFKETGEISTLEQNIPDLPGTIGIGHTRWATHGIVSQKNAHPHVSRNGKIAVVHNGIIENHHQLREHLQQEGFHFTSDTDSEVIAHLIEKHYTTNLEEATRKALKEIKGSYALAVMCSDEQNRLVAARRESPIILGIGEHENLVASDIPALLEHTNKILHLDDHEIATITNDSITIKDLNGNTIQKQPQTIDWNPEAAAKAGYPHFMAKEIHQQPQVLRETLLGRLSHVDRTVEFEELHTLPSLLTNINNITIIACGTSYYAGLTGKYYLEHTTNLPVSVELASEYHIPTNNTEEHLIIAVTQSGETADTLNAMRRIKNHGGHILCICNTPGSTASRIADWTILNRAGPEIGVAATKTFSSQILLLRLLSIYLSQLIGTENAATRESVRHLKDTPKHVQQTLDREPQTKDIAHHLKDADNVFFIGRRHNYPIALEGALKLKEISYIHAEGFAAGELKHGPFALLTPQTPVVALLTQDETYDKMLSNIGEIKARNAPVIAITDDTDQETKKYADNILTTPATPTQLSPLTNTIVCQLLAYHTADLRNCPIDKPRNLAKSVTVE